MIPRLTFFSSSVGPLKVWKWVALFCLGLAGVFPGSGGQVRPLGMHEIFVAQTAEEMIQHDNFLIPTFNDELRLEKPPLSYWVAVVSELIGDEQFPHISEFEARLPSALAGIALIFVVVGMGFVAFEDRRIAWVAGALLATTWGFHIFSHSARPEMLYTFFCSMEMLGFLLLQRSLEDTHANLWAGIVAWGGFAGAILTKGPLFPLFIFLGVGVSLLIRHPRPSFLRSIRPFMGLTFAVATGVYFLYLASVAKGAGGFWVDQMTQSKDVPLWLRPLRMYFPFAAVKLLLPWSLLLIFVAREIWKNRHPLALMLGMSSLFCLIFVSFSGKLRLHYILPAIPFLCVLMAWAGVNFYDRQLRKNMGGMQLSWLLGLHVWVCGAVAVGLTLLAFREVPYKSLNPWISVVPWMIFSVAIGGITWYYRKTQPIRACVCLIIMVGLISAGMGFGALGYRTKWYMQSNFAAAVAKAAPPNLPMFTDHDFAPYLLYYGGRKSKLISPSKRISAKDLLTFQKDHRSPALLVVNRDKLKEAGLKGRELYQGQLTKHGKTVVLFQTDGEGPSQVATGSG